jgi:hypothetical protein
VHQPPAPADRDQPAGQPPIVHVPREVRVDPAQAFGVEAQVARIGLGLQLAHPRRPLRLALEGLHAGRGSFERASAGRLGGGITVMMWGGR